MMKFEFSERVGQWSVWCKGRKLGYITKARYQRPDGSKYQYIGLARHLSGWMVNTIWHKMKELSKL